MQPNTVGRLCAGADHYLKAVLCRSRGGLPANEKDEQFASNDNMLFCLFIFSFVKLKEQEEAEKELMADERETALKNMREKFSSDMEEEKKKLAEEQKEALEELREKLEKEKETVSHFN